MARLQREVAVDQTTGAPYLRPVRLPRLRFDLDGGDAPLEPPVIPTYSACTDIQRHAFKRWLQSFPHWQLPRNPFPGWKLQNSQDEQYFASDETEEGTLQNEDNPPFPQYAPLHMLPSLKTDPRRYRYAYQHQPPLGFPPDILPNRVPDLVEWDDVYGGTLHWTPHPWRPHPLPHPQLGPQHFWASAYGGASPAHWRGPGGLTANAVDPLVVSGGHPLPGNDPWWTPSAWQTPLPGYYSYQRVLISPYLAPNSRDPVTPHVLWDASTQPLSTIRRMTSRGDIVDLSGTESFDQPATWPNTRRLLVNLPYMHQSWGPVTIEKKDNTFVTVKDVFEAVAKYLHTRLTQAEYDQACSMYSKRKDQIAYAFHRRCWASPHLHKSIYSDGAKRVDLLETPVYWGSWPNYSDVKPGTVALDMGFLPHHAIPQY